MYFLAQAVSDSAAVATTALWALDTVASSVGCAGGVEDLICANADYLVNSLARHLRFDSRIALLPRIEGFTYVFVPEVGHRTAQSRVHIGFCSQNKKPWVAVPETRLSRMLTV